MLYLSERRRLKEFTLRSKLARRFARRFVAGETLDQAIAVTRDLNEQNMVVTLDHLGESVDGNHQARQAMEDYIALLDRIDREKVESGISIKLTQLGLAIDYELCRTHLRRIAAAACERNHFVRIDMEASQYVQPTLDLFYELHDEFQNVGVVIQSYLRRSEADARALRDCRASVRLCKGAYMESPDLAFQKKEEVDENFVRLMEILMDSDAPLAIATHDLEMIEAARRLLDGHARRKTPLEFQMLYGVRRDLQQQLVDEGYLMRVYVPYGTEWYPYFMRRMAERPANLVFVLRALKGK